MFNKSLKPILLNIEKHADLTNKDEQTLRKNLLKLERDPPNIITYRENGFDINMNNMEYHKPIIIQIPEEYLIWKNKDDGLVWVELAQIPHE